MAVSFVCDFRYIYFLASHDARLRQLLILIYLQGSANGATLKLRITFKYKNMPNNINKNKFCDNKNI